MTLHSRAFLQLSTAYVKEPKRERSTKMQGWPKYDTLILGSALLLVSVLFLGSKVGASTLPAKLDGFVYGNRPYVSDTVLVEAFYDPLCPDSRDSWPPLKQAVDYYGSRVSLVVHLLPLPLVLFPLIYFDYC